MTAVSSRSTVLRSGPQLGRHWSAVHTPQSRGGNPPTTCSGRTQGSLQREPGIAPKLTCVCTDWGEQVLNIPGWSLKESVSGSRMSLEKKTQFPLQNLRRPLGFPGSLFTHPIVPRAFGNPLREVQSMRAWSPETWATVFTINKLCDAGLAP